MKTQDMIDEELEMELLDQMDIEEEEEEEELDLEEDDDGEEDRGDDVDPDLPDDDPEVDDPADDDDDGEAEPDKKPAAEEEIDADDLADLAGEDKKKSSMVPHARFNEVNKSWQEERAERLRLEEEVARLRGSTPKPADKPEPEVPAFDFDDAEKRMMIAQYEGDQDAAMAIRKEIRVAERAELERLADERAERLYTERKAKEDAALAEKQKAQEQTALQAAAAKAVEDYPFLDSDSPEANEEAIEEVIALRDHFLSKGQSATDALMKAVARVGARYAVEEPTDLVIDKKKATLTTEQIQRNLDREKRIPSRDAGVGERANKINYEALTEEQFDALPDAEKRKARGDLVG